MTDNIYRDFKYDVFSDGKIISDFPNIGQLIFKDKSEFMVYVDGYHTTKDCFSKIETELRNAIDKHPKFCKDISGAYQESVTQMLAHYRKVNEGTQHADAILLEELFEAVDAYNHCRKEECLKELAQCGAVIIRMMDFVKKEMEGK
jgi:hypothetical protein